MPKITILRQTQQSQLNAMGGLDSFVRIDFQVGNYGTFNVSIPIAEFSTDVAHAAIMKVAAEAAALQDKIAGG